MQESRSVSIAKKVSVRPHYSSLSLLKLSLIVRSMTSCSPLTVMSSSFLPPSASMFVGGHAHGFSHQMQNPLQKLCTFQSTFTLVMGDDSALELIVDLIELGFIVDDSLIDIPVVHDISLETPITHVLDCIKEDKVGSGWPLNGLVDPMG